MVRSGNGQPCSGGAGRVPRRPATLRNRPDKAGSDQRAPILHPPRLSGAWGSCRAGLSNSQPGGEFPFYESAAIPNRSRANCPREVFWAGSPRAVACSQAAIAAALVGNVAVLGPSDPWQWPNLAAPGRSGTATV